VALPESRLNRRDSGYFRPGGRPPSIRGRAYSPPRVVWTAGETHV